jgi:(R,R)-butanediol dehydrogenase/meso-butanediol dehydrogenase/diacetyl reductase
MKTMLAARYLGPNRIEASEVLLPSLGPGEALIKVEACGFCGSDINIVAGTHPRAQAPLTIGHELSGIIVQLADRDPSFAVGDRVTTYPLISCGICHACTHGNPHVCRQLKLFGFDVDGGMAEFVKLPIASLMKLPARMSPQIGALIEPLAVAVHGVDRFPTTEAEVAVIMGAGPIGLLTALVAKERGIPTVLISDVLPSRLELAKSIGLDPVTAGVALRARVMELTNNNGADVVYECAGHPSSALEMTTITRSRGTIVNLGVFKEPVEVNMQEINFKEIKLIGSRVYERCDFTNALDMAMTLPLDPIISAQFALRDVSEAFHLFRAGSVCKVLILPTPGTQWSV